MNLTDEELTLYAIREAQLILADYVQPGQRDCPKTINELLSVLDRDDVVEAVDRLEAGTGMGWPSLHAAARITIVCTYTLTAKSMSGIEQTTARRIT